MIFHANPGVIDLGVNIDHVATLRNARGTVYPDPIQAALQAEEAGADLITLHLREDRRHIRDADVHALRPKLATRMNLECAITSEMLDIACRIKPQDVCLVPEKRAEVTTEGGLDVVGHFEQVSAACRQLADAGIRVVDEDLAFEWLDRNFENKLSYKQFRRASEKAPVLCPVCNYNRDGSSDEEDEQE